MNHANMIPTTTDLANMKPAKKTKAAAFEALRGVLADLQLGAPPDPEHLATLYHQFLPPRPKKPRTAWDWVCSALAKKNEARYYLRYVHVTERFAEATDGHRLHRVPLAALDNPPAPGMYHASGEPCTDEMHYPETDRLVPDVGAGDLIERDRAEQNDTQNGKPFLVRRFRLPADTAPPKAPRNNLDSKEGKVLAFPGDVIVGATVNDRYHQAAIAYDEPCAIRQREPGALLAYWFDSGAVALVMPLVRE